MPLYIYRARNEAGQLVAETVAFRDETSLRQHLRKNGLYVLDVAERKTGFRLNIAKKVRLGDLIVMCRQLRTMKLRRVSTTTRMPRAITESCSRSPVCAESPDWPDILPGAQAERHGS